MIWVGIVIVIVAIILGAAGLIAGTAYTLLIWVGAALLIAGLVFLAIGYRNGRHPLP